MKINSIRYVFENKQPELRRIIVKYGLPPASNSKDLWKKVNYLVAKFKNEMLRDIAEIHPDKELIVWNENQKANDKPNLPEIPLNTIMQSDNSGSDTDFINTSRSNIKQKIKSDKFSSVCGCSSADGSCADGDDYSNCNGGNCSCGCGNKNNFSNADANTDGTIKEKVQNNLPLIVVGSLLAVGVLLYIGNRQSA